MKHYMMARNWIFHDSKRCGINNRGPAASSVAHFRTPPSHVRPLSILIPNNTYGDKISTDGDGMLGMRIDSDLTCEEHIMSLL